MYFVVIERNDIHEVIDISKRHAKMRGLFFPR